MINTLRKMLKSWLWKLYPSSEIRLNLECLISPGKDKKVHNFSLLTSSLYGKL